MQQFEIILLKSRAIIGPNSCQVVSFEGNTSRMAKLCHIKLRKLSMSKSMHLCFKNSRNKIPQTLILRLRVNSKQQRHKANECLFLYTSDAPILLFRN